MPWAGTVSEKHFNFSMQESGLPILVLKGKEKETGNMRTGGYGARQVVGGLGTEEQRIGLQETGEHGAGG